MPLVNRKGDTIVEVMIAIVLLGAAIGSAFAIAGNSQLQTQANHEYNQAHLLANQQAELILNSFREVFTGTQLNESDYRTAPFYDAFPGTPFCMQTDMTQLYTAPSVFTDSMTDTYLTAPADCIITYGGAEYNVAITTEPSGAPEPEYFFIKVTWESLTGSDIDSVELRYGI